MFIKSFSYNNQKPFNGVFSYISQVTHVNDIHSARYIEITVLTNSTNSKDADIRTPLGFNNPQRDNYWCSSRKNESWYQIDLRENKMVLTGYVYSARKQDYLEKWEVLGSNDSYNWVIVDQRENPYKNKEDNPIVQLHFQCNGEKGRFSYFRIQTHGIRVFDYESYFGIYGLEFYGYLYSSIGVTFKKSEKNTFMRLIFIFVIC